MSKRDDIVDGSSISDASTHGLVYTCLCGWIDIGHANPTSRVAHQGAENLWADVSEEKGNRSTNAAWHKVRFQMSMTGGALGIKHTATVAREYAVRRGLRTADKESVALSIFTAVGTGFEAMQGKGLYGWVTDSSYSAEDLVSNLIGFYRAVRKGEKDLIRRCRPVPRSHALQVWDTHGAVGSAANKNKEAKPWLFPCKGCKGGPATKTKSELPEFLAGIAPASGGAMVREWKDTDAVLTCPAAVIGASCRRLKGKTYDSLSRVAEDLYSDPLLWPVLYDEPSNRVVVGESPHVVRNGQVILAPALSSRTAAELDAARTRGRSKR